MKRWNAVRLLAFLVAGTFLAAPQTLSQQAPTQPVTVAGKVLRSNSSEPLEGARIILRRTDNRQGSFTQGIWETEVSAGEYDPASDTIAARSDQNGVFRFRITSPARFYLFTEREGYVRTVTGSMAPSFEVAAGVGLDDIVIQLTPEGSLSGHVVDAETRQPVAGLAVTPHTYRRWASGRALVPASRASTTDADGSFHLEGLAPEDYYLEVHRPLGGKLEDPAPVDDFAHAVRTSYAPTWYPGVESVEQALTVSLLEGGGLTNIDLLVPQRPMASVRARVVGADKVDEARIGLTKIDADVGSRVYWNIASGLRKVGEVFQVDHLAPGRYWFHATVHNDNPADVLLASYVFDVGVNNIDTIDLPLRRGAEITGVVRLEGRNPEPDQPVLPTDKTLITLFAPLHSALSSGKREPAPVKASDGSFRKEGVMPDRYLVGVARRPSGYQLSEVIYNNTVARCHLVSLDPEASSHRLEITLAPAPGSIQATITDGSRPSPGATAVLIPECVDSGLPTEVLERTFAEAVADGEGRANFDGLLPGVYRLIAYPEGSLWNNDPNLLSRLLNGQEVRVTSGVAFIQIRSLPAIP